MGGRSGWLQDSLEFHHEAVLEYNPLLKQIMVVVIMGLISHHLNQPMKIVSCRHFAIISTSSPFAKVMCPKLGDIILEADQLLGQTHTVLLKDSSHRA